MIPASFPQCKSGWMTWRRELDYFLALQPRSRVVWADMVLTRGKFKTGALLVLVTVMSLFLTACATKPIAPVSQIESLAGAVTVPYRISESGRLLIDVSINGAPARPLSLDTGATVSVIYSNFAKASDFDISDRELFVRGLVGEGDRPVIEDIVFQIGGRLFPLDQVVMLDSPSIKDEAVGLLGGDILRHYTVLFNRDSLSATFVPRGAVDHSAFSGWTHIPLRTLRDKETDADLYFATTKFVRTPVSVLIDTGSNLNFINWKLAKMDENIRRLERNMVRNGTLQGALDSTSATVETVFYDLKLGGQHWDEIPVVVTGLDGLASIAPVDEPLMVAGATLFTPYTVAFDLKGLSLYLHPDVYPDVYLGKDP